MKKTVVCAECKLPFLVEGALGTLSEILRMVSCPYSDCIGSTEVKWPIDSTYKTVPIYARQPSKSSQ
jgi:hypothetical protein